MAELTRCHVCGVEYDTSSIEVGKRIRCRRCQAVLIIGADDMATVMDAPIAVSNQPIDSNPTVAISPNLLEPGTIIGKCEIRSKLGQGGMGAVYLATHTTLQVPVAIKVIPHQSGKKNLASKERFMREAHLAARIQHANVMSVMDADQDPVTGLVYMVLEYVDGGSVRELLENGPLSQHRAIEIISAVAEALVAAEKHRIIHRDIKPDNIMLTKSGDVKLADLGLAKETDEGAIAVTQSLCAMGTPAYMSPEQAMDSRKVDCRSDIYSLGATLFHMLTGRPPFVGDTAFNILSSLAAEPTPEIQTFAPHVTDAINALCLRMMAKDPEQRYASASELLEEFGRLQVGQNLNAETVKIKPETPSTKSSGSQSNWEDMWFPAKSENAPPTTPVPKSSKGKAQESKNASSSIRKRVKLKNKCPHCSSGLVIPVKFIGKKIQCPNCKKTLTVRKPTGTDSS